jgi:arginine kinase
MWNTLSPGRIVFKNEARKIFLASDGTVNWDKVTLRYQYLKTKKESLGNKHFTENVRNWAETLSQDNQQKLLDVMIGGLSNEDASVGVYATSPSDYKIFSTYLEPIIREYHNISGDTKQKHDWDIPLGVYLLDKIHPKFNEVSMRARVARNVTGWNLPSFMDKKERLGFEAFIEGVFSNLPFQGTYHSLTPGHANQLTKERAGQMRESHYLFNDMTEDNHLTSSGIASDWPHGRGIWLSTDKTKMIWVDEEDHLRVISIIHGNDLGVVDNSLSDLLKQMEILGVEFAEHPTYGVVTTCPTNTGTGKRQSVLATFPNLSERGSNEANLKKTAKLFGLQARGLSGEHSQMDEAGTADISPLARFGVTEAEVTKRLYEGLTELYKLEIKKDYA